MPRITVPYCYRAFGTRRRVRESSSMVVLATLDHRLEERSLTEADTVLQWMDGKHGKYAHLKDMPVLGRRLYVPVLRPDGSHVTPDDSEALTLRLVKDQELHRPRINDPFLHAPLDGGLGHEKAVAERRLLDVEWSEETEGRRKAEEFGDSLLSIDGLLHTSRHEPAIVHAEGRWRMADVLDTVTSASSSSDILAPAVMQAVRDMRMRLEGDLDAVDWRLDVRAWNLVSATRCFVEKADLLVGPDHGSMHRSPLVGRTMVAYGEVCRQLGLLQSGRTPDYVAAREAVVALRDGLLSSPIRRDRFKAFGHGVRAYLEMDALIGNDLAIDRTDEAALAMSL